LKISTLLGENSILVTPAYKEKKQKAIPNNIRYARTFAVRFPLAEEGDVIAKEGFFILSSNVG
jgi:hypothetical protein